MSILTTNTSVNQPSPIAPAEVEPDYESFITEDAKPVDSWYCERQHRLLTDVLHASWKGAHPDRPRCVATDVGLFYAVNEPAIVPDVMVSLDVAPPTDWVKKKNRSYFVWLMGKSPEMTIEVVSNAQGGELTTKMEIYARIGVIYYVVWDPMQFLSKTPLQCFALNQGDYSPCEPWFPKLDLGVVAKEGEFDGLPGPWLRWCDKQGELLPTGVEQALVEKQRAEIAEHRAAILAEKLRAAGIDPDA
jgi:Uma2 family endonuclease